jgi:hypothetical protein
MDRSEEPYVSIWKTSHRGLGEKHLQEGYPADDFPGAEGQRPNGRAYFAKDRWIAEVFAAPRLTGYDNFVIEVRVPADEYQRQFQKFEQPVMLGDGVGTQLAIPAEFLDALNIVSTRLAHRTAGQPNGT